VRIQEVPPRRAPRAPVPTRWPGHRRAGGAGARLHASVLRGATRHHLPHCEVVELNPKPRRPRALCRFCTAPRVTRGARRTAPAPVSRAGDEQRSRARGTAARVFELQEPAGGKAALRFLVFYTAKAAGAPAGRAAGATPSRRSRPRRTSARCCARRAYESPPNAIAATTRSGSTRSATFAAPRRAAREAGGREAGLLPRARAAGALASSPRRVSRPSQHRARGARVARLRSDGAARE